MNHNSVHSPSGFNGDGELSFTDILLFLKEGWRTIALAGLAGLLCSSIFLLITPNQYEAVANIAMGKVSPGGPNIEEPQALIYRMGLPTSLTADAVQACNLQAAVDSSGTALPSVAEMNRAIKLTIPKGVNNVVELKVMRLNNDFAKACANSIFQIIELSQGQLIGTIAQLAKADISERLVKLEARLAQDKALLTKAGDPRKAVSPTYFAVLSEIRALEDEREKLRATLDVSMGQATALLSPVFVSDKPVYPNRVLSLVSGFVGGVFLGLAIALARRMIAKINAESKGLV